MKRSWLSNVTKRTVFKLRHVSCKICFSQTCNVFSLIHNLAYCFSYTMYSRKQ